MIVLSPRETQVLNFIEGYRRVYGRSPSFRQLVRKFRFLSSTSVASYWVNLLLDKGVLSCSRSQKGAILPGTMRLTCEEDLRAFGLLPFVVECV
jgi:hypothetical protein